MIAERPALAAPDPLIARLTPQEHATMSVHPRLRALVKQFEDDETFKCARSARYFIQTYAKLVSPAREAGGLIDWEPWPYLLELLDAFERERLVVVLKARQLGVSWLMAAYCLWMAKFYKGARVLILSQGEKEAAEVLQRAKNIENALPAWLKNTQGKSNESVLEFPQMLSRLWAAPATAKAGRSEAATLVFLDEFAFHPNGDASYTAIKPTIDSNGGQLIAVSTSDGLSNAFHALYAGADGMQEPGVGVPWFPEKAGPNNFYPVFLPWSSRQDRDSGWYAKQKAEMKPAALASEYPATADEAFQLSGYMVFDKDALAAMERKAKPPIPRSEYPDKLKGLTGLALYAKPSGGYQYLLGADVAEGGMTGDASCCVVLDALTLEEVGMLHERGSVDVFSDHLDLLATAYPGLLAVEKNNHGLSVNLRLRQAAGGSMLDAAGRWVTEPGFGRPYVLYHHVEVTREPTAVGFPATIRNVGWMTTRQSKKLIIDDAEEAVRKGWGQIHSPLLISEMRRFVQDSDSGHLGAPAGEYDDSVIAYAIALRMRPWVRVASDERPTILLNRSFRQDAATENRMAAWGLN